MFKKLFLSLAAVVLITTLTVFSALLEEPAPVHFAPQSHESAIHLPYRNGPSQVCESGFCGTVFSKCDGAFVGKPKRSTKKKPYPKAEDVRPENKKK